MRNLKKITVTNEFLANQLQLKNDVEITDLRIDPFQGTSDILMSCNRFPELKEGQCPKNAASDEIFDTGILYDEILKFGLTYEEAQSALKQGCAITRSIWEGYWTLERVQGLDEPIIIAHLKGKGNRVPAQPYQSDLLAEDWMVVVPIGKEHTEKLEMEWRNITWPCQELLLKIYEMSHKNSAYIALFSVLKDTFSKNIKLPEIQDQSHQLDITKEIINEGFYHFIKLISNSYIEVIPFSAGEIPYIKLTIKGEELAKKLLKEMN